MMLRKFSFPTVALHSMMKQVRCQAAAQSPPRPASPWGLLPAPGLLLRPSPLPGALFCHPICPILASQGRLPRWTVSPLSAETVLASAVRVPRPHTVTINSETFLGMLPDIPPPQFSPNVAQKERFAALAKFKSSIYRILIATDVASR